MGDCSSFPWKRTYVSEATILAEEVSGISDIDLNLDICEIFRSNKPTMENNATDHQNHILKTYSNISDIVKFHNTIESNGTI